MNKEKVTLNNFSTISVIGEGRLSKILLVKNKTNQKYYAMKSIKKSLLNEKERKKMGNMEKILKNTLKKNNFIVNLHWTFQNKSNLFFIVDYCPGGDLCTLLEKKKRLTISQTKFYAAQIILALEYLHENKIIYRGLKPESVLISQDGYIKLTNFEYIKKVEKKEAQTICGNIEYLSPEILLKKGYGKESDIWSLGCIIYELLFGISPFYDDNSRLMINKILNQNPIYPQNFDPICISFLNELLQKQSDFRLGCNDFNDIKKHKFFNGVDWEKINLKLLEPFFKPKIKDDLGLSNFKFEYTQKDIFSCDSNQRISMTSSNENFDDFSWNNDQL